MADDQAPAPVAWAFYYPDGRLRFIIDDEARMKAWLSAHTGPIVPLIPQTPLPAPRPTV